MTRYSCPEEYVAAWDNLADISEPEIIFPEVTEFGGFEYLVAPQGALAPYTFGGYDEISVDSSGSTQIISTIIVPPEMAKHTRGFLIAHMLHHKYDDGSTNPHQCVDHDKCIQHDIVELEPSLLEDFFEESGKMYREGLLHTPSTPRTIQERSVLMRYDNGLKNARSRGKLAIQSTAKRIELIDRGLELPDGKLALAGVDSRTGDKWYLKLSTERNKRGHTCRNCSQHIKHGSERITTVIEHVKNDQKYTHHHYHVGCFNHVELAQYGALSQVPADEVPTH